MDGLYLCFFFFSSRRRHTRLTCDWSSDVCSSDLTPKPIGPESLRETIKAAGQGVVDQGQGWGYLVGGKTFLVEVDLDVRNLRLPSELEQQGRVVKGTGRGIYDVAANTAVLAFGEGLLAELESWFC